MAHVRDPVCGMTFDSASAVGRVIYRGQVYYFCSEHCLRAFEREPERFAPPPARR